LGDCGGLGAAGGVVGFQWVCHCGGNWTEDEGGLEGALRLEEGTEVVL
jgi:hypothetical protein